MNNEHESVKHMWENYLKSIEKNPENYEESYTSWYFCNNEKDANELAQLVLDGTKRGTTSLHYWYGKENEPVPEAGRLSIITDWDGTAKCIIRTKKVYILPFKDVNEELAGIEGEGDKSLKYWRDAHLGFFISDMEGEGKVFTEEMKVVFEEFEVVYR
jgi:uncharacterized protein YhfF